MKSCLVLSLFLFAAGAKISSAQTLFIETNSVWKYLANGTSLDGINWQTPAFPDTTWSDGVGRLGFGGDGEQTVIGLAANGYTNFYFRHTFQVTGAADIGILAARYQRDDGLILYLNGTEVLRSNMRAGPVGSATEALSPILGADESTFLTNMLNSALLMEGANVIAAELHQYHGPGSLSTDIGWYLELRGGPAPRPPNVALVTPSNGVTLQVNNLTLNATASDTDGTVIQVEFFAGETRIGSDFTAPYGLVATAVSPGNYTLRAIATDSQGARGTSAPITVTVVAPLPSLIPFGATWRYLDSGADQGFGWTAPEFVDNSWSSGAGELGFGDNDEATIIRRLGNSGAVNITTYFRHTFNVSDPKSISSLVLRLARDDGAIVYLNGAEVLRDNLTNNIVNYLTTAAISLEDEPIIVTNISPASLVVGANTVAVEIHQQSISSSDASFDLQLIPNAPAQPPVVQLTAPRDGTTFSFPASFDATAIAYDLDGIVVRVQFLVDGVQMGTIDMSAPYSRPANGMGIGQHRVEAIATDNNGLTSSASVLVSVLPGNITSPIVSTNSFWRYLDDGVSQATDWRFLDFNDATWFLGRAELGFGDNDEMTLLHRTNTVTGLTNVTFYFRHEVEVPNPGIYSNLVLGLRRDDGGVVYINGTEAFRSNMTNGPGIPILSIDFAGNSTGAETAFNTVNLSPSILRAGRNLIAVEVHQQSLSSSDLSFELQLLGQRTSGPVLAIAYDGAAIGLSWFPNLPGYVLQEASSAIGPWSASVNQSNPQIVSPLEVGRFFRVCSGCP